MTTPSYPRDATDDDVCRDLYARNYLNDSTVKLLALRLEEANDRIVGLEDALDDAASSLDDALSELDEIQREAHA